MACARYSTEVEPPSYSEHHYDEETTNAESVMLCFNDKEEQVSIVEIVI